MNLGKFGKIDFCKIKKITAIEIITLLLVFMAIGIYYSPKFMLKQELQKTAKIKADNAIFTAKALEEFAQNKTASASTIAKKVADELNKTSINHYDKNMPAYTFEKDSKGCNCISFDDKTQMIVLSAFNNKNELVARTVIKPPSFVVYSKLDDKK